MSLDFQTDTPEVFDDLEHIAEARIVSETTAASERIVDSEFSEVMPTAASPAPPAAPEAAPNPLAAIADLVVPDFVTLAKSPNAVKRMAEMAEILTSEDRELIVEDAGSAKAALDALEVKRKAITDPLFQTQRAVTALFAPPKLALEQAIGIYKTKILAFDAEEDRKAAEAKAKAEAEQREVQRKAAEEATRVAADSAAAARLLQDEAQAAAESGDFATAQVKEMEAATVQGDAAEAVAVAQSTMFARPSTPTYSAPVRSGTASKTKYKVELVDKMNLVKFIAQNPAYLSLVEFSQKEANKLATAMKTGLSIPGAIKVTEDKSIALLAKK